MEAGLPEQLLLVDLPAQAAFTLRDEALELLEQGRVEIPLRRVLDSGWSGEGEDASGAQYAGAARLLSRLAGIRLGVEPPREDDFAILGPP